MTVLQGAQGLVVGASRFPRRQVSAAIARWWLREGVCGMVHKEIKYLYRHAGDE